MLSTLALAALAGATRSHAAVTRAHAAATRSHAAEPPRIEIDGHESLSGREIASILAPEGRATADESTLAARADSLLGRLALEGHPFARVEIAWEETPRGLVLAVTIDEGPSVSLSSIVIEDATGGRPAGVPSPVLSAGVTLSKGAIEREVEALLEGFEEAGRPFAAIRVGGVAENEDGAISLRFNVDPGPETRFGVLSVSGNEATRANVIERESGIVPGEPYRSSTVKSLRSRLEKLGFFDSVSAPVVSVDPLTGLATVGVKVEEGPAGRVSGVLGYAAGRGEAEGLFTGIVDVELGNIAGTGRAAAARWERIRSDYTRIAFSYNEPWLLGAPIDVGVRGEQTVNDTVYTTTEGDVLVTARMGERTRVTWTLGGERFVPGAADEATTTSYRTSMSGEYDGTDVPGNPTRGGALSVTVVYSAKKGSEGARDRSGAAAVEAWAYVATARRQVVALRAMAAALASTEDEVPFHEQLPLGGALDLRGYREEQFRGTRVGLASVEYRFLLSRRSRALVFVDAGYFYRGGANFAKGTKLGYGIGLRGETRLGIIALDYGLGEGDDLLDGKLHVGLIREF